jgi:glycosyltransferase involved in cell wall biosynthesis
MIRSFLQFKGIFFTNKIISQESEICLGGSNKKHLKPMKLLILNGSHFSRADGGQATFIQNMHDVLHSRAEIKYLILPEYVFKQNLVPLRLLYTLQVLSFYILLRHKKYNFIISHTPEASYVVSFFRIPFCHIFHGNNNPLEKSKFWYGKYFSKIFNHFEERIINKAKICYTVGENRNNVKKIFPPIKATNNDVEPEHRSGIFFAGRMEKVKNVGKIISIYSNLPNYIKDDNKLHIIGSGTQEGYLKKIVNKNNVNDSVIFYGHLSNAATISTIKSFKILLMASSHEGFPMIIAESLALGIPVISTDVGGISDIIKNGFNGFCIPTSSEDITFKEAIITVLENYKAYSINSKNSSSVFSPEFLCEQIFTDYNSYVKYAG